jgi:hypothetical protein
MESSLIAYACASLVLLDCFCFMCSPDKHTLRTCNVRTNVRHTRPQQRAQKGQKMFSFELKLTFCACIGVVLRIRKHKPAHGWCAMREFFFA